MDIILIENLKVLQNFYTFTIEGSHFIKGRSRNLHLVRLGPYSMAVFRASPSDACYFKPCICRQTSYMSRRAVTLV